MSLRSTCVASLVIWWGATLVWAQEPATWQTRRIEFDEITQPELVRVPLDSDVYAWLRDDNGDLRVLDGQQHEVAYVLHRRLGERITERLWVAEGAMVQLSPDEALVIRFELKPDDPVPNRLNIVTPLFDFEQSVKLFGTVEGVEQELLSDIVFDYRRYMDVRRTELKIPPTTARQYRLVIATPTAEEELVLMNLTRQLQEGQETGRQERLQVNRRPFRIERLELRGHESKPSYDAATLVPYPITIEDVVQDEEHKRTVLTLSSQREPLTRMSFETPDRNFNRLLRLRIPDASGEAFVDLDSTHLRWFELQALQEKQLAIRFARRRATRYQVVIENRDSPPIEISGVSAEGDVDDVFFLGTPGQTYTLAYGKPDVAAPSYDTAAIVASLQKSVQPQLAKLGPPEVANFAPPVQPLRFRDLWNNPWIIGPIILALVLIFGWLLYRAAAQIESVE